MFMIEDATRFIGSLGDRPPSERLRVIEERYRALTQQTGVASDAGLRRLRIEMEELAEEPEVVAAGRSRARGCEVY